MSDMLRIKSKNVLGSGGWKWLFLFGLVFPGMCLAFDLVTGGQAAVRVVVPDGDHPVTVQAGEILVRYVKEITGAELTIIVEKEGGDAQAGQRVFLGATRAALDAGIDVSKLNYDGFVWKVIKGDLYIAGRDFTFASAKGSARLTDACHGTARGIYRLLEEYGGVRWFLPTPKGVVIPKSDRFSVSDDLNHTEEPPFGYTLGGLAGLGEWSLANAQRRAVDVLVMGHSWDGALRGRGEPKKLFEEEPERFAEKLYAKYPDRKIVPLAYCPTVIPSSKIKQFPPNVMISLTREYPAYYVQFADFDKTMWTYWWGDYHAAGLTPNMMAHKVAECLQPLVDNGVMGVFTCGGGGTWGLAGITYYAYTKLAWNPSLDLDALLDDYCRGVYHAAAPDMREFFNLLEARVEAGKATQTVAQRAANMHNIGVDTFFPGAYPPNVLNSMDLLLARAKAKIADDDTALQWLALTELQYRYLKTIANGFTLYREYRYSRNQTPELCRELSGAIKAREDILNEIKGLKENKTEWLKEWFPGANSYIGTMVSGGSIYATLVNKPPFSEAFAKELAAHLK